MKTRLRCATRLANRMRVVSSIFCGFGMNATSGLHCKSWGNASATQRLRFVVNWSRIRSVL